MGALRRRPLDGSRRKLRPRWATIVPLSAWETVTNGARRPRMTIFTRARSGSTRPMFPFLTKTIESARAAGAMRMSTNSAASTHFIVDAM